MFDEVSRKIEADIRSGMALRTETAISRKGQYFLEKTELSEIVPRPTELMFDILKRIYAADGPVSRVYARHGIRYTDTDCLRVIDGELYVDRERELHGLLPGYGGLGGDDFVPRFRDIFQFFPTIRNILSLNIIRTQAHDTLFAALRDRIERRPSDADDPGRLIRELLDDYEVVFEVNLLAGLSMRKLLGVLDREAITLPEILGSGGFFFNPSHLAIRLPAGMQGNSLDILDESDFEHHDSLPARSLSPAMESWWSALSEYRKAFFRKRIAEVVAYERLREFGRWLAVKDIGLLRRALLERATLAGFLDSHVVLFGRLDTALTGEPDEAVCLEEREKYDGSRIDPLVSLRPSLSADPVLQSKGVGLSVGIATGVLVDVDGLLRGVHGDQSMILHSEVLSPDLVIYLDRVVGIVSLSGGMLSHAAIVARERGIPVVAKFCLGKNDMELGQLICIDGAAGTVVRI